MSDESEGAIPRVPFGFSELEGIERVVWAYIQYLDKSSALAKNRKRIATLQQVRRRLATQLRSEAKEVEVFLNVEELEELLQAMLDFATLVKRIFPKNEERDSVIDGVNVWRLRLMTMIAEFDT